MNIGFKAPPDFGKTSLAVHHVLYLLSFGGYRPEEVISTVKILVPGCEYVDGDGMMKFLQVMVARKLRHRIVLIDEADGIVSHRFWSDKVQTKALLGMWQDVKLFNWILWTGHLGGSVDLLLRECTHITIIPVYDKESGNTRAWVIDNFSLRAYPVTYVGVKKSLAFYDRWAPVDYGKAAVLV